MNASSAGEDFFVCIAPTFFNAILIIFGLFIVAENILMIYTIWRTPKLQTNANIFVVSLGVIDMLIGVDIIGVGIFGLLWGSSWPMAVMYPLMGGGSLGLLMGSFLHMGIIAIDRYTYIAHPYFYLKHCTKKMTLKVIASIWLMIVILCILPTLMDNSEYNACFISTMPKLYKVYIGGPLTYLMLLITCIAYLRIALLSNRQRRTIAATANVLRNSNSNEPNQIEISRPGFMKSVRFFVVMFGFFFLFSVPPMICTSVREYHTFNEAIFSAILLLIPLNSMTNFFINYTMNNDFRGACKKMFRDLQSQIFPLKYVS